MKYDLGQASRRTQKNLGHVWVGRTSKISISKSPKEFVEGVRLQGRSTSNKHGSRRTLLWPVDSVTFSEAADRHPCQKQHAELQAIGMIAKICHSQISCCKGEICSQMCQNPKSTFLMVLKLGKVFLKSYLVPVCISLWKLTVLSVFLCYITRRKILKCTRSFPCKQIVPSKGMLYDDRVREMVLVIMWWDHETLSALELNAVYSNAFGIPVIEHWWRAKPQALGKPDLLHLLMSSGPTALV